MDQESDAAPNGEDWRRSPTIYDVARAAGVAPSTVSRTFARPGRVSATTAARVRQVAADLGYRVNPLPRALPPPHSTSMIALVVAEIGNPFHTAISRGAQAAATEAGHLVVVVDAQESDQLEREALERALPTVEGVVLASSRASDAAIRMIAKQRPTVVLNRDVADVPSVVTDIADGVRQAAGHLAQLGHTGVTYVSGPEASWTDGMRWRSLREAASELGVRIQRTGPCSPTVAGGTKVAEQVDPVSASAVVAYNDQMAIGLIRGLQARGVRVPEDVSVVGFDNTFNAELVTPGLTTVAAPLRALGEQAVRGVLALLSGAPVRTGQPLVLPTRLVVRASTGPCRSRLALGSHGNFWQ